MNERVAALFYQAADRPSDERRALLDAACQDDPGLRAEVERLLAEDARLRAEDGAGAFLESPLMRSPDGGGVRVSSGSEPSPRCRCGMETSRNCSPHGCRASRTP